MSAQRPLTAEGSRWQPVQQANGRGRWVQGPAGQRSVEAVPCPGGSWWARSRAAARWRWAGPGLALLSPMAHALQMRDPSRLDGRRGHPPRRWLLLVMTVGLGLVMAGSLGIAVTAPYGFGRTLGLVLLFLSLLLLVPLVALWRLARAGRW
jgi:hypothetical protein